MIFGAIIFWQRHSRPNDSLTPAEYESSLLTTMSESLSGSITFWSKVRGGADICSDIKDPAEPLSGRFSESRPSLREDGARTVLLGC